MSFFKKRLEINKVKGFVKVLANIIKYVKHMFYNIPIGECLLYTSKIQCILNKLLIRYTIYVNTRTGTNDESLSKSV